MVGHLYYQNIICLVIRVICTVIALSYALVHLKKKAGIKLTLVYSHAL